MSCRKVHRRVIHGNRQQAVVNAATNSYTAISNGVPVAPTYDDDGNMTACNGWTYVWNGENRLVLASNNQHVVEYVYDHIGRMVQKKSNGETVGYIWDGYNIIAEVGAASTTYNVWGLDLSGSMQGAGGVGGLLAVSRNGQLFAAAYDANGNITEYVNAAGSIAASRTYGPFGETVGITGAAGTFTHWWSTKPWDNETGFSEYEYRMYCPELGRWINRDPIEEVGSVNLYSCAFNSVIGHYDFLGLSVLESFVANIIKNSLQAVVDEVVASALAGWIDNMALNKHASTWGCSQGGSVGGAPWLEVKWKTNFPDLKDRIAHEFLKQGPKLITKSGIQALLEAPKSMGDHLIDLVFNMWLKAQVGSIGPIAWVSASNKLKEDFYNDLTDKALGGLKKITGVSQSEGEWSVRYTLEDGDCKFCRELRWESFIIIKKPELNFTVSQSAKKCWSYDELLSMPLGRKIITECGMCPCE